MTALGLLSVNPTGSITAPSTLIGTASVALASPTLCGWAPLSFISIPALRGLAMSDGVDFQFHTIDAVTYLTGPRAPRTAPVLVAGTPATRVLTATANFANGETITVGDDTPYVGYNHAITMVTALAVGSPANSEALIGATLADSINNIVALVNGTGGQGTLYWDFWLGQSPNFFRFYQTYSVIVLSSTSTTITYQATLTGASGNAEVSTETCANASFPGATFTGGVNPAGGNPTAGARRYAYSFQRKADGAITAISDPASLTTTVDGNVTVSAWDSFITRDATDLYRLFRTTTDAARFYKLDDDTASPYTDATSDATILSALNYVYDETLFRPYAGGYPQRYTAHCLHNGAIVGTGAVLASKQSGTGTSTAGGYTIALTSFRLTTACIGRFFRFTADAKKYRIVDITTTTITLSEAYPIVMTGQDCEVTDERNPFEMLWSVTGLINQWPVAQSLVGTYSNDSRGNTAVASAWGNVILWTMTGLAQASGEASTGFRFSPQIDGAGAFCQGAVIKADKTLFWLGPDGAFSWIEDGALTSLSSPMLTTDGEARGIAGTIARITANAVTGIVGNYNPTKRVVRWWVPVDGSLLNNLVITYDLKSGAFTFANCDGVSSATTGVAADGSYVTIVGTVYGTIDQLDNGNSEGAYGFECRQSVSSYATATNTITVSGTPLPTSNGGLAGCPIYHLPGNGDPYQRLTVASNTSSTLVLVGPPDTAPAAGDVFMVGALVWRMESTWFSYGSPEMRKILSSLTAQFQPTGQSNPIYAGQMWCGVGYDGNEPRVHMNLSGVADFADLTSLKGSKFFDLRIGPGRRMKVVFLCFAPGFDHAMIGFVPTFRVREAVKR